MSTVVRTGPAQAVRPEAVTLPIVALALGILGDRTLAAPLGLGAAVAAGAAVVAFVMVHRKSLDAARWVAAMAALTAAAGLAWRDSPVLHGLDVLLFAGALGLLANGTADRASLSAFALRVARSGAFMAFGAPPVIARLPWARLQSGRSWRHTFAVARGLLLAVPILLLFALLLANADAVFALRLRELFDIDLGALVWHALVITFLSWLAAGLLNAGASTSGEALAPRPEWMATGAIEAAVVLGLVDLLFGGFVWVQVRYLFGGARWIDAAGLTYSQYARRGFFELVAVTALVLPLLLFAHWIVRPAAPGRRVVLALAGVQVGLVGVMLVSALKRMGLYQAEYGQTELRFYTTAFMVWLAGLLAAFLLSVLPGRRDLFAQWAAASAWIVVIALHAINPDAHIVATNRTLRSGFDAAYALTLSADAVPELAATAPGLEEGKRDLIWLVLRQRWDTEGDWRRWNLSRGRAEQAFAR
jgi:hypothetical protein